MWWDRTFRNKVTVYSENRPIADAVDQFLGDMPHTDIHHTSILSDVYLDIVGDDVGNNLDLKARFPHLKPPFDPRQASYVDILGLLVRPFWGDYLTGKTRIGEPPYKRRVVLIEPDMSEPKYVYVDNREIIAESARTKGRKGTRGILETVLDGYYSDFSALTDEQIGGFAIMHDLWTLVRGDPHRRYAQIVAISDRPEVLEHASKLRYLSGTIDMSDPTHIRTTIPPEVLHNQDAAAIVDLYTHLERKAKRAAATVTVASLPWLASCTAPAGKDIHGQVIVTADAPAHREIVTAGTHDVTIGIEHKNDQQGKGLKIEPVKEFRLYVAQFGDDDEEKAVLNPDGRYRFTLGTAQLARKRQEFVTGNVMLADYGEPNNAGLGGDAVLNNGNIQTGGYAWVVSDALKGAFIGAGQTVDDRRFVGGLPQHNGPGFLYYRYEGSNLDEGILFGTKSSGVLEPLGFAKFLETPRNDPDASLIESPVRFVPPGTSGKAREFMGALTHTRGSVDTWGAELYTDIDSLVVGVGYAAKENDVGHGMVSLPIGVRLEKGYLQLTTHVDLDTHKSGVGLIFRTSF